MPRTPSNVILPLLLGGACAAMADVPSISWQQAGGAFQRDSFLTQIVGQGFETPMMGSDADSIQSGFLAHPLLVNGGPFVVSSLSDRQEVSGFASTIIKLDTVFADFEGDPLNYTVKVNGNALAANVKGSTLNLAGQAGADGTVQVVVTATDGTFSVADTFAVDVQKASAIARPTRPASTLLGASVKRPMANLAMGSGKGTVALGGCSGESCLSVDLQLPGEAAISVSIFDNLGNPVVSLTEQVDAAKLRLLPQTTDRRRLCSIAWNLRSSTGQAVGTGVYLWKIQVITADGQKLETIRHLGVKAP